VFDALDNATRDEVERRLQPFDAPARAALVQSLGAARALLGDTTLPAFSLRPFRADDMGAICERQAVLYAESNGWGRPMEALLLDVTAKFLRTFETGREQCWIAERGGRMAGSVFCCDAGDESAQLRLLYVEPDARSLGIGEALVRECIGFARAAGYVRLWLWTHTVLAPARRLYAKAGFRIVREEVHHAFGKPEAGEIWELPLAAHEG
jgi:GNAT superfamily N-acetyltransferase